MRRQCVSDWNPDDDRDAPDWWLDMTEDEQDAFVEQAKLDHEMEVEAERRKEEES